MERLNKISTNIFSFVMILGLIGTGACSKLDKLTQFDMDYQTSVLVPSSIGIDVPVNLMTPDIESNAESEFAVNDTRKDMIEDIRLKTLDLVILTPSSGDFSFLNSIEIFINADGLPELSLAWENDIPGDIGSILQLETADVDVKEYIKKDVFQLKVTTVTDKVITQDHEIEVNAVFGVDAKVLGI